MKYGKLKRICKGELSEAIGTREVWGRKWVLKPIFSLNNPNRVAAGSAHYFLKSSKRYLI
ncbi:MAG: hypothetical protein ACI9XO_002007 [Paraglaciecola sp.]|jgi:hypothetical protein